MIKTPPVSVWTWGTCLLLAYGAVKEFRPSVPYLNVYLLEASSANLTDDQLSSRVYPFWTYSYLVMLVPVMLLTDWLLYKPIIVSEGISLVAVWSLLLWGNSLFQMQIMQICFGWAAAAEVAYFSYIYATVTPDLFQKLTSWVRMATLIGRCCGYGLGQVVMLLKIKSGLKVVTYMSLGSVSFAFFIASALPSVSTKKMLENQSKSKNQNEVLEIERKGGKMSHYFRTMWKNLRQAYSNKQVVKWSIWWALSTCVWAQVSNFIQVLWSQVDLEASSLAHAENSTVTLSQDYNGLTEAINQLLGAGAAYSVQFLVVDWLVYGELCIGILSCAQCIFLAVVAKSTNLAVVYVLYVSFCVLYQLGITVATYNVARHVPSASHGLIFGTNTFLALALQTILTLTVADYHGFFLAIRKQFFVYAGLQGILMLLFVSMGLWTFCKSRRSQSVKFEVETTHDYVIS